MVYLKKSCYNLKMNFLITLEWYFLEQENRALLHCQNLANDHCYRRFIPLLDVFSYDFEVLVVHFEINVFLFEESKFILSLRALANFLAPHHGTLLIRNNFLTFSCFPLLLCRCHPFWSDQATLPKGTNPNNKIFDGPIEGIVPIIAIY